MKPRILVVGDFCLDEFIYVKCDRLSPEAPVPVLNPIRTETNPGMVGNVSSNLEFFGADVQLLKNADPIVKTRYIDDATGHYFVRVDKNDYVNTPLSIEYLNTYLEIHGHKHLSDFDAVVLSDYNKGFLTIDVMSYIFHNSKVSIIDSKKIFDSWADEATWIKINDKEHKYNLLKSNYLDRPSNQGRLIVTRGAKGTLFNGNVYPVQKVDIIQSSGAGDTFTASFITHWLANNYAPEAIKYANEYATQACMKKGVVSQFD